jgi:hypothetical protein
VRGKRGGSKDRDKGTCDRKKTTLYRDYSFNPASLFFASSTSAMPGSASFQMGKEFLVMFYGFSN